MTKRHELTVVFEQVEHGWTQAMIAEIPGVITAAPTRDEARDLVIDALHEYLRSLERDPSGTPDGGEDHEPLALLISA